MLAPSLPFYSESQSVCLHSVFLNSTIRSYREFTVSFLFLLLIFLRHFPECCLLPLASSFLIVCYIIYYVFITCCFCFVVAVVLGLGSIAVCSDNNHSFRGDSEQPVHYSLLTIWHFIYTVHTSYWNVVHVYGKQHPEDQYLIMNETEVAKLCMWVCVCARVWM